MAPTLLALTLTRAAHAQGMMDFSGAQTLLGTFKTIQELLRHANSRITLDVYTHGDTDAKRNALSNVTGLFVVKPAA